MSPRRKKSDPVSTFLFVLFFVGLGYFIKACEWLVTTLGKPLLMMLPVLLCLAYFLVRFIRNKLRLRRESERRELLMQKYDDPSIVQSIMAKELWVGAKAEHVRDMIGDAVAIDHKVLKTKVKETWKYGHQGGSRYSFRVNLDNGVVVGWDAKG